MNNIPFVSIIIPAYNEESRLPKTLDQIADFIKTQTQSYEVIVVENGSTDQTYKTAEDFAADNPAFQVIHEEQSGKGRAVRTGMLAAKGQYRFMCDADLSMPIAELLKFLPPNFPDAAVVIGSREAEGAVRFDEPDYRHVGGRLVNWMIRLFAVPKIQDTQCGFKLFRADAAEDLFSSLTVLGWSFDIEVLFLARKRGYLMTELGIDWYYQDLSHVSPIKDTLRMVVDILKIRLYSLLGRYAKKKV